MVEVIGTGERGVAHWEIPLANNEKLEFFRDWGHIGDDRAGERSIYKAVSFSQKVVNAEVFISGFNIRQTRGGDTQVSQIRVDAWIESMGSQAHDYFNPGERQEAERRVTVKLLFTLVDEDPTGHEDFNEANIGFTVIAHTVPH